MFHATAMVPDYDRAVERLGALFGFRVLEYGESDDPAVGRRGGMGWVGDGSLEIGQPTVAGAAPDRFVQRTGGGMQGVAVWVDDFTATADHLAAHGVHMPVVVGRFGFTSPRDTFGIQLEWSDFTVEEDPRTGAPEPPFPAPPLVDVTHLAFVGAVVDDPVAAARRMEEAFATAVTFEAPDAEPGAPVAGVSLGDCTLALFPLDQDGGDARWGRRHDRPRVSLLGLAVDDLTAASRALERAGVAAVRSGAAMLVLDPAATGDVEIALVDRLLPGDPRA
jgi:catechol 2,3-dioxygenase-like lactoylglutathione lyase family enzyme